jgi:hypothetical protein
MEQKTMTQTECVYEYMKEHGSITQLDALRDLGVMRLASRISDLRKKGIKIESAQEAVKTRYGGTTYIKRYRLAETEKPEWEERMLRTFLGSRANEGENNG